MSRIAVDQRASIASTARRFAFPNQTTFLSQAILLEEAGPPRAPALACLLGFTFVAIAILASILIQIDIVTNSSGQIVAADGNQVLQSFEGGIVDQRSVEEGQIVQEGDILLSLEDPEAKAQRDRLAVRETALTSRLRRLRSLAGMSLAPAKPLSPEAELTANQQMSILPVEQQAMIAERSLIQAEINSRAQTAGKLRTLEDDARRRVTLFADKRQTEQDLYRKGLSTTDRLLDAEQQAIDATVRLEELQGQIREAETNLLEARRRLEGVGADRTLSQADQLSSLLLDLDETRQQIKAMNERLDRAVIRAPTRAIILEFQARHPGQTIAPGDPVVEIIPIDGGLKAEIRLPPSEISHVQPGQPARIAIDGIEPHRHGYLEGTVAAISPSTFVDADALPYYRASIAFPTDHLNGMPLTPGMTLQAQIKTGERTILEYLLKPVYRAWNTAFRER